MKKFVILILSMIVFILGMVTAFADNIISPAPITNISVPKGGLSPYIHTEEVKEETSVSLDNIETSPEFEAFLYDALYEQQDRINIYDFKIPASEFQDWFVEFTFRHPELFLYDGSYTYYQTGEYMSTLIPSYQVDKSERDAFLTVMNEKLDEYYDLVKDIDDELKKYLLIHSKIIRETHYAYDNNTNTVAHTAYSFFVKGASTCQGYANALMLIGDKVGLEVSCCFNRAVNVRHIWNYIKINDKWYHTDTTWDDYSAKIDDTTYNNEKDQGAYHLYFLCSDEAYAVNGHGNKSDYKTFENELIPCTDKTYEDDKWAFNLKSESGGIYLTDFDYENNNLFFDLVGVKDSNSNPVRFVTNNLWGKDTYVSEPLIYTSSVKYYTFTKKDIPSAQYRCVLKNDEKITSIVSHSVSNKGKYKYSYVTIPVDQEYLSCWDEITVYLWNGIIPLSEKVTITK